MKEYRLSSWPDLPAEYQHTRYQRVLHDMSQRFMSLSQLAATSSLGRGEVRDFVRMLASQELVQQRQREGAKLSPTTLLADALRTFMRAAGRLAAWRPERS